MTKINFVRHRRRELTKIEVTDARNFRYGVIAFIAVIVVLVIAMSARFYLVSQIQSTTTSIASLKQSIKNKSVIEEEYLIFMKKVEIITSLFGQRREKQQALAYFSSLFDPEVIVSSLSYDADSHTLSFSIRAPSIFSMKRVFDTMSSANVKERYPTFSIGQIARASDASYSMDVVLPLPTRPPSSTAGEPSPSESGGASAPAPQSDAVAPAKDLSP